jgi:uncharacterized membrane protein (UPF0136 family)
MVGAWIDLCMKNRTTVWLVVYGVFLITTGIIGYEITQETSTSAIANGIVFGTLMIIMGILHQHGRPWTMPASLAATSIFTLTFLWRGALQWFEVVAGNADRSSVAILLTVMALMSGLVTVRLLRWYRH